MDSYLFVKISVGEIIEVPAASLTSAIEKSLTRKPGAWLLASKPSEVNSTIVWVTNLGWMVYKLDDALKGEWPEDRKQSQS